MADLLESKEGTLTLPSWFIPIGMFGATVGGSTNTATGEIYINSKGIFSWWCTQINITGLYSGEIIVILK